MAVSFILRLSIVDQPRIWIVEQQQHRTGWLDLANRILPTRPCKLGLSNIYAPRIFQCMKTWRFLSKEKQFGNNLKGLGQTFHDMFAFKGRSHMLEQERSIHGILRNKIYKSCSQSWMEIAMRSHGCSHLSQPFCMHWLSKTNLWNKLHKKILKFPRRFQIVR